MTELSNRNQPILILVRGLPGSGKSYLAAALQEAFGPDRVVMLDPDATDYDSAAYHEHVRQATADGVDPKLHAYRFLRQQAYDGIAAGKIIIWNQPFTNLEIFNKMTANLELQAQEHGKTLQILVVEVSIDDASAKARVVTRKSQGGHGPSDATFQRFVGDYRSFAGEGYDTVSVNGAGDVHQSVAAVMAALKLL